MLVKMGSSSPNKGENHQSIISLDPYLSHPIDSTSPGSRTELLIFGHLRNRYPCIGCFCSTVITDGAHDIRRPWNGRFVGSVWKFVEHHAVYGGCLGLFIYSRKNEAAGSCENVKNPLNKIRTTVEIHVARGGVQLRHIKCSLDWRARNTMTQGDCTWDTQEISHHPIIPSDFLLTGQFPQLVNFIILVVRGWVGFQPLYGHSYITLLRQTILK